MEVFQIFVKKIEPDYYNIWNSGKRYNAVGTGFGIIIKEKKYIVTNSHVVRFGYFIECSKYNSDKKFQLKLFDIANEIDLALLEPLDLEFWDSIPILEIAIPPAKGEEILVIGFPQGGNNPSITKGIISRIIPVLYSRSILNLAIQVDSAINPGNSGGPVLNLKKQIIGIAFSHNSKGQNICFIIPSIILNYYKEAIIKFGKFPGVCDLELTVENLTNINMQKYYKLQDNTLNSSSENKNLEKSDNNQTIITGIFVEKVNPVGNLNHLIENEDIIISIDDILINNDQMIYMENYQIVNSSTNFEKIPYWHILSMKYPGDNVKLEIIRKGKKKIINFTIDVIKNKLVPSLNVDLKYYIAGGLIFAPLNMYYLYKPNENQNNLDINKMDLFKYLIQYPEIVNQQIIILIDILPTSWTTGYNLSNIRLLKINDRIINNIVDVYNILEKESTKNENFVKFEFENNKIIILHTEALKLSSKISLEYLKTTYTNVNIQN